MESEVYEFVMAETYRRKFVDGGPMPLERSADLSYFREPAANALDKRLVPYDSDSLQFSMRLDNDIRNGRLNAPWAIVVLDREYRLAGHVIEARGRENLPFTPFRTVPSPRPPGFIPGVGVIFVRDQQLLSDLSHGANHWRRRS